MSYPEDRVLIGVINRMRDFRLAQEMHWYRIPEAQFPEGIDVEYLGIFLSRAFRNANGAVQFYAQVCGVELVYRKWLIPFEPDHPCANDRYYKLTLGALIPKVPAVRNTDARRFAFIRTTWRQFVGATQLQELSHPEHKADVENAHTVDTVLSYVKPYNRILPDDQLYF